MIVVPSNSFKSGSDIVTFSFGGRGVSTKQDRIRGKLHFSEEKQVMNIRVFISVSMYECVSAHDHMCVVRNGTKMKT